METALTASSAPTLALVQADSFLTLHYRLSGPAGDVINTFGGQPATVSLGAGDLSPALEAYLVGLPEGARQVFAVPAGEAFGPRDAQRMQWVARSLLNQMGDPHERYATGDVVQFPTPDGLGHYAGTVLKVGRDAQPGEAATEAAESVLFDFNHPLAGQPVTFEVWVIGVL
jgi:FKBP-type peptidyl-prolyl cis-trans isomerase SlpA